jgi:hypothetical protein
MTFQFKRGRAAVSFAQYAQPQIPGDQGLDHYYISATQAVRDVRDKFENLDMAVRIVTDTQKRPPLVDCPGDGAVIEFHVDNPLQFEMIEDPGEGLLLQIARMSPFDLKKHKAGKSSQPAIEPDHERHIATGWSMRNYNLDTQNFDVVRTRTIQTCPSIRQVGDRVLSARRYGSHYF